MNLAIRAEASTPASRPAAWKVLLAYAIIYLVWGSTFYAIRIGVLQVPPFLLAAARFFLAGLIMFVWLRVKGTPLPTRREWVSASIVAVVIFVLDYGFVFWAERRVASGVTAVMLATIPLFMAISEIVFLRTQRLTLRLAFALLIGLGGVLVLVSHSLGLSEEPIDTYGAIALVIASCSWSVAAVLMRKLPLPASKPMSSSVQMLLGGIWLAILATAVGDFRGFDPRAVSRGVWFALAYLIVAGSIIAYTAYVWLLHHEPPTKVGTYAYVNPVVAVAIGYFLGGEPVGPRTLLGTLLVLVSVIVITTTPARKPEPVRLEEAPQPAD
jgi:drug/metabolite transporter (DMT)-like permease